MAGGGTGGHVIPAIAVAREVCRMGYRVLFVGTERGVESRLVPAAGFRLEKIRVGGIKNLGIATRIVSLWRLVAETAGQIARFGEWKPAAVFSMGGYVAGPPVLAALLRGVPVVVMEPNAVPGFTNRQIARWVKRALISFEETARFFPAGRTEVTGLPVREEFFALPTKRRGRVYRADHRRQPGIANVERGGARRAGRCFAKPACRCASSIRPARRCMKRSAAGFRETGLAGEVAPFIADMPAAFAQADLIVCRSGAGAVSELAAAGKPSVLIPFPFAADQHQLKNAEAFERAGAALHVARSGLERAAVLRDRTRACQDDRARLKAMGECARKLAHPGAARRAAEILVQSATETLTERSHARNNKILECFFHGSICTSRGSAESA